MTKNKNYNKLIHQNRWLQLRRHVLTAHPICQRCEAEGRLAPATEVHHIVPCETALGEREMERLMFDPANLQALCHDCHVKTHIELGRSGKAARKKRTAENLQAFKDRFFGEGGKC